jgi:hypothetical protein
MDAFGDPATLSGASQMSRERVWRPRRQWQNPGRLVLCRGTVLAVSHLRAGRALRAAPDRPPRKSADVTSSSSGSPYARRHRASRRPGGGGRQRIDKPGTRVPADAEFGSGRGRWLRAAAWKRGPHFHRYGLGAVWPTSALQHQRITDCCSRPEPRRCLPRRRSESAACPARSATSFREEVRRLDRRACQTLRVPNARRELHVAHACSRRRPFLEPGGGDGCPEAAIRGRAGQVGKGGVVRDDAVRAEAVTRVQVHGGARLTPIGALDSPVHGPAGNPEILLVARRL